MSVLEDISSVQRKTHSKSEPYIPYLTDSSLVPEFLEVGNPNHQVRITASTHDTKGILQHSTPEALANTVRLENKAEHHIDSYTFYHLDEQPGAKKLIVGFDISASAAIDAVSIMRKEGEKVSLLIPKTLFPIPNEYYNIMDRYEKVVMVEENLNAQYARILFGHRLPSKVASVGAIGKMITPQEIINGGK